MASPLVSILRNSTSKSFILDTYSYVRIDKILPQNNIETKSYLIIMDKILEFTGTNSHFIFDYRYMYIHCCRAHYG
jgi:hypothetical protein